MKVWNLALVVCNKFGGGDKATWHHNKAAVSRYSLPAYHAYNSYQKIIATDNLCLQTTNLQNVAASSTVS